jgi:hypothetical protein
MGIASTEGPPSGVVGASLTSSHAAIAAVAMIDKETSDRAREGVSVIGTPFQLSPL